MEEPKEKFQVDLSNVDAINNLDTARLALRWALERLHALEKSRAESSEKTEREVQLREKAEEDHRALLRTLALRNEEATQRELYYAKLEEFLSLKLDGKLDVAALAKRETEAAQLQEILRQRQGRLDKEYLAKREELEREYQRLKSEAGQEAQASVQRGEETLTQRRANMDKEYVSKMIALREKEFQLKQQEKHLNDRQAHFQEFYANQRAQLDRQVQSAREEVEDQVSLRLKNAEQLLIQRRAAWEVSWAQEKTLLLKELAEWQNKAQEHLPRLLELEARQAESQAQKSALEIETASLRSEIAQWKKQALEQAPQALHELQLRAETTEESARRAREELEREAARRKLLEERELSLGAAAQERLDALETSWVQEKSLLLKELAEWQRKAQEPVPRLRELEARQAESEAQKQDFEMTIASLRAAAEAALQKEEALRRRVRDIEDRALKLSQEHEQKELGLENLKDKLAREKEALLAELGRGAGGAQQTPRRLLAQLEDAKSAVARLTDELGQETRRRQESEKRQGENSPRRLLAQLEAANGAAERLSEDLAQETRRRKSLEQETEGLRSSVEDLRRENQRRQSAEGPLPSDVLELQKRLADTAAKARQTEESLKSELARRAQELEELSRERTVQSEELESWKRKAAAAAPPGDAKLQGRLEEAEEKARLSAENLAREIERGNRLEERESGLEAEYRSRFEALEAERSAREEALLKREHELQERQSRVAKEFEKKRSEIDILREDLEQDIIKLIAKHKAKPEGGS